MFLTRIPIGAFFYALALLFFALSSYGQRGSKSLDRVKSPRNSTRLYNTVDVRFLTSLGMGFGRGTIAYETPYDFYLDENGDLFLDQSGQPFRAISEYSMTINASIRLALGASIEYKRFEIGLLGGIESYQLGRAVLRERIRGSSFFYKSDTNTGGWPVNILHYGTFIGYNIPVGETFVIGPKAGIGTFSYLNTKAFEEENPKDVSEFFTDRLQYNFGVIVKAELNFKSNLSLSVTRMITEFDASNYFLDITPETFTQTYKQTFVELGYSYSLYSK